MLKQGGLISIPPAKSMKIRYKDKEKEEVDEGIFRIWLIDESLGAKNFFMRMFEILPGKGTKEDKHPYEHEIFVVSGEGKIKTGNTWEDMYPGDAFFIPGNVIHSIKNSGKEMLKFICIVPSSYRKYKKER